MLIKAALERLNAGPAPPSYRAPVATCLLRPTLVDEAGRIRRERTHEKLVAAAASTRGRRVFIPAEVSVAVHGTDGGSSKEAGVEGHRRHGRKLIVVDRRAPSDN